MPCLQHVLRTSDFQNSLTSSQGLAVAVSGGADSMALLHALMLFCQDHKINLTAISVDHGLRPEAKGEAQRVADWCVGQGVQHHLLTWQGDKPDTALQSSARKARYDLMAQRCLALGIAHLCVAHHQDDQAETFLMRLASGSGLNGLGAMRAVHAYDDRLTLLRPLLGVPKDELIAYCAHHKLPYCNDPSNQSDKYARVRVRKSMDILTEEGLSAKRLSVTALRLARAESALDYYAAQIWQTRQYSGEKIILDAKILQDHPPEMMVRIVARMIEALGHDKDYLPRMEKIEALSAALRDGDVFKARTLGGVIFARDDKAGKITATPEVSLA